MNEKIARMANYMAAFLLLLFGILYLFKGSFMPYHGEALACNWEEIASGNQILILALMRTVAGGYLAVALTIVILQKKFTTNKTKWIPLLLFGAGVIVSITSVYATLLVRFYTPGNPPTALALGGVFLLALGLVFNLRSLS